MGVTTTSMESMRSTQDLKDRIAWLERESSRLREKAHAAMNRSAEHSAELVGLRADLRRREQESRG